MRQIAELLRHEPRARVFAVAILQSSLGTGAGYIGLVVLAKARFDSAWAITLILLADLVPAMLLGPLFGAMADRWSRRTCIVVADAVRAVAFLGIAVAPTFELTLLFAALAGIGTGLFNPAALASLPSVVAERRLPALTSLYGAIADLGFFVGPVIAGAVFLVGSAESLMWANAVTFGMSALLLAGLRFGAAPVRDIAAERGSSLLAEAREGLKTAAGIPGVRTILAASGAGLFFAGLLNVGELPFALDELGTTETGYALLAAVLGLGFIGGSLTGSKGGELPELRRRYLLGLLLLGIGLLASGLAPALPVAVATFALFGFGNGVLLVYQRLLIQRVVPDGMAGRVFGVEDALTAWAFGIAFISAGAVIALVGARWLLLVAGAGGVLVWLASAIALRKTWVREEAESRHLRHRPHAVSGRLVGENGADRIGGRKHWLALLDDLDERRDDLRVELGAGIGH